MSSDIHILFNECTNFKEAIKILKRALVQRKGEIYARHEPATRTQQAVETLDHYRQALYVLSKDCKFKDFAAQAYKEEIITDAFISGLYAFASH